MRQLMEQPDCNLRYRWKEAKFCHMGHALMENRNGLAVGGKVTHATGTAEREVSEALLAAKVRQTGKRRTGIVSDKVAASAGYGMSQTPEH